MQIHKMGNGQYAVCWKTVNYFGVWRFHAMAGIKVANDNKEKQ